MNVLALIPARSGSKGIPHKNIRMFRGKPLLAHSIEHAQGSEIVSRIIVSTDSEKYAEIARQYGAETPFLRPHKLSQDLSTDLETFVHALNWLSENENYVPNIVVHLRPTYPVRKTRDIDAMIRILLEHSDVDSVRSVTLVPETPYKMWLRDQTGILSPVASLDIPEPYNQPRQALPTVYLQNACIDVVRSSVILDQHSMTGRTIHGYVMAENYDIDTEAQLAGVVAMFESDSAQSTGVEIRTFCFDIDGVIAKLTPDNRYEQAQPCQEVIDYVNALYKRGHRIILHTARGSLTGLDWTEVTTQQMYEWGVQYHTLTFGKPAADYYIDDRAIMLDRLEAFMASHT